MEKLQPNALVLDIGSGRGLFGKHMADSGLRVIGIDFESGAVAKTNSHIKDWGLAGKLRFMEADALEIPFADASFDGATDFGLMENLFTADWSAYAEEVARVLKPGGYYLNVSLSRETPKFMDFSPKASADGDFEKYGVHYHFFTEEEMRQIFGDACEIISSEIIPTKDAYYRETLFRKK